MPRSAAGVVGSQCIIGQCYCVSVSCWILPRMDVGIVDVDKFTVHPQCRLLTL